VLSARIDAARGSLCRDLPSVEPWERSLTRSQQRWRPPPSRPAASTPFFRCRTLAARVVLALTLLGSVALLGAAASPASAAVGCDRVASPSGSDSNSGSAASPFRNVQKLVD
jgi:hypothetical protein